MLTEAFLLKTYGPFLNVKQVAALWHYAPGTVENQIAKGTFPVKPINERGRGKPVLFHYAAVARAIDEMDPFTRSDLAESRAAEGARA